MPVVLRSYPGTWSGRTVPCYIIGPCFVPSIMVGKNVSRELADRITAMLHEVEILSTKLVMNSVPRDEQPSFDTELAITAGDTPSSTPPIVSRKQRILSSTKNLLSNTRRIISSKPPVTPSKPLSLTGSDTSIPTLRSRKRVETPAESVIERSPARSSDVEPVSNLRLPELRDVRIRGVRVRWTCVSHLQCSEIPILINHLLIIIAEVRPQRL